MTPLMILICFLVGSFVFNNLKLSLAAVALLVAIRMWRRRQRPNFAIDRKVINASRRFHIGAEQSPQLFSEIRQIIKMEENLLRELPILSLKIKGAMNSFWIELSELETFQEKSGLAKKFRKEWLKISALHLKGKMSELSNAKNLFEEARKEARSLMAH